MGKNKPTLQLEHVKQNAIKFSSNEHEYSAFLSSYGILIGHGSTGSTYLDQYKKQSLLQTVRSKLKSTITNNTSSINNLNNYRDEDGTNSSALSSHDNTSK